MHVMHVMLVTYVMYALFVLIVLRMTLAARMCVNCGRYQYRHFSFFSVYGYVGGRGSGTFLCILPPTRCGIFYVVDNLVIWTDGWMDVNYHTVLV